MSVVAIPKSSMAQTNEAIAESLFIEGKRLFSEKRYSEACQKLSQSHKADPAGGTVLLLAMCYEQEGRIASAWAKYSEALALARKDGRADRVHKAQEGISSLSTQLAHVTVVLSSEAIQTQHMEFTLDDVGIPLLVDAKVPVDPGKHRLVVRADGYQPWSHEFEITERGALVTITVPGLEPLSAPQPSNPIAPAPLSKQPETYPREEPKPVSEPPPPPPARTSSTARTLGWVIGGAGLATVGVGGYFAFKARSLNADANDRCPAKECSDPKAVGDSHDAASHANTASWLMGFGAAALVTGGALVIFGGKQGPTVTTTAMALPSGGVLTVSGKY